MTSSHAGMVLALSMLPGVGPVALRKAIALGIESDQAVHEAAKAIPQISKALLALDAWITALENASIEIERAERDSVRIICLLDQEYPEILMRSLEPPPLLYVKGSLQSCTKTVAVIGTRKPTPHGRITAHRLAAYFAERSWSVVSGLALGCDAIAHQATLDVGGHTIAVLAHGLQTVSPVSHRALADAILDQGGALISQFPFGVIPSARQFVMRDKVQAGLARGVVMIQSSMRGGSLHASRAAIQNKRILFVPTPTASDRESNDDSVQANIVLNSENSKSKMDLLHCDFDGLKFLKPVIGRDDYSTMEKLMMDCMS
jgi:DNA processing protein